MKGRLFAVAILLATLAAPLASALDVSLPTMRVTPSVNGASLAAARPALDGSGVVIAILDTGVDGEHPALAGAALTGVDVSRPCGLSTNPLDPLAGWDDVSCYQEADPPDNEGHGSHVAGIAIGRPTPYGPRGVAPGARILDVKIAVDLTPSAPGLYRGLLWVKQWNERHPATDPLHVDVVSVSAGSLSPGNGTDATSLAARTLVESGVVVVAAAGNCGGGGDASTCPRTGANTISAPAIARGVIAVAASDTRQTESRADDRIADFSSRGPSNEEDPKPNVAAPGVSVESVWGGPLKYDNRSYIAHSGTSMATPMVSGVVALMLQANPRLAPADVKSILEETAFDLDAPGWDAAAGHGEVDAYAAVAEATRRAALAPVAAFEVASPLVAEVPLRFDARASRDPDGAIRGYRWDFGDGAIAEGAEATHAYAAPGNYVVKLVVSDDLGLENATERAITIAPAVREATITMTPANGTTATTFTFDARSSVGAGGIVAVSWTLGDAPPRGCVEAWCADASKAGADLVAHQRFATPGAHVARLSLLDASGRVFGANVTVQVDAAPPVARVVATPIAAVAGATIQLDATASEVPGGVARARWDFGDGSTSQSAGLRASHVYARDGTYEARVTIESAWGLTSTANATVVVSTPAPVARLLVSPLRAPVGATVAFDARGSTEGNVTLDLGDGRVVAARQAFHQYATSGERVVRVTLTDAQGRVARTEVRILVEAAPAAPPQETVEAPPAAEPIEAHGAASVAPDPGSPPALLPDPAPATALRHATAPRETPGPDAPLVLGALLVGLYATRNRRSR